MDADGSTKLEKIFKEINENTTSYTYHLPPGLLSATQFTQPALTLMEKASFEDMQSKGLVQRESSFAGHSLGEYSALVALAKVMPIESCFGRTLPWPYHAGYSRARRDRERCR